DLGREHYAERAADFCGRCAASDGDGAFESGGAGDRLERRERDDRVRAVLRRMPRLQRWDDVSVAGVEYDCRWAGEPQRVEFHPDQLDREQRLRELGRA